MNERLKEEACNLFHMLLFNRDAKSDNAIKGKTVKLKDNNNLIVGTVEHLLPMTKNKV